MFKDNIDCRRLAILLALILYMQLQKDIGLKSSKEEDLSALGIRAMKVELKASDILPRLRQSSMILNRSTPMMSKKEM